MALGVWQRSIVNTAGDIQGEASIEVRAEDEAGMPLVPLYSDRAGTTPIGNPFSADTEGFARFYCTGGSYQITATKGAFSRTWRYVPVGLAAEGDFLTTGQRYRFSTDTTEADPGNGYLAFNNSTLANVTEIYIDNFSFFLTDLSSLIDFWDDGGETSDRAVIQIEAADGGAHLHFQLTGTIEAVDDTGGTGYRKLTGTVLTSGGTFDASETLMVSAYRTGKRSVSAGVRYRFSNTITDSDPGAGFFRFNNAMAASVTELYLDNVGLDGATLTTLLDALDDGGDTSDRGIVQVTNENGSATWVGFITNSVVDGTGYRKLSVTYVSAAGTFTANEKCVFTFERRGIDGADGIDASGDVVAAGTLTEFALIRGAGTVNVDAVDGSETAPSDLDDVAITSILPADGSTSNRPTGGGNWLVMTMCRTASIRTQIAVSRAPGDDAMYIRHDDGSTAGWTSWSRVMHTAKDTTSLQVVINGNGSTISTGIAGDFVVPFDCVLTGYTALADQTGSIVVDVWSDTYGNYPPTDADTIIATAGTEITISSAVKAQDTALTGWSTTLTKGDTLRFNVDSVTSISRLLIELQVTRT